MKIHYNSNTSYTLCGLALIVSFGGSDGYKSFLSTTNVKSEVTCKNCLKIFEAKKTKE